jgi:hypothetical protein
MREEESEQKQEPTVGTTAKQTAMAILGEDFQRLLDASHYPDLASFSKAVGISSQVLQKILSGEKTGLTATIMTVYLIAGRLNANVDIRVPTDDWHNKTPLSKLWEVGAVIRLIAK